MNNTLRSIFLFLTTIPGYVNASLFNVTIESEGDIYQASYDSLSDLVDDASSSSLKENIPAYTDNSAVVTTIDFRGIPIVLTSEGDSSEITMTIDSIDVTEFFQGNTRNDSVSQLENWFKGEGDDSLTLLIQEFAASTPSDPIAGNPTSQISQSAGNDFDYASDTADGGGVELNTGSRSINGNMVSIFTRYSNYSTDGVESSEISLPLAYTIRFDQPEDRLIFRIPLAYVVYDGSEVYNVGFGVGYGRQISPRWRLTPAIGYSLVGSEDIGSLSQLASASMASSYEIPIAHYQLTIGNMLGYYSTLPTEVADVSQNPDIKNTVLRNGASFNIPTPRLLTDTSLEVFFTDTRYFGSDIFINHYNEIGFSFGLDKAAVIETDADYVNYIRRLRAGAKYIFSDQSHGYSLNFGYTF